MHLRSLHTLEKEAIDYLRESYCILRSEGVMYLNFNIYGACGTWAALDFPPS